MPIGPCPRSWRPMWLAVLLVLAILLGWHPPARAQEIPLAGSLAEEAELHFVLGVEAFAQRDYRKALEHLLLSNRLAPNKNVVYNIARCHEQLGQYEQAYQAYSGYVSKEDRDEARRRDALDAMTGLEAKVALVFVDSTPPGSTVYIDREDLGARGVTPVTLAVSPGEHKVIVGKPGYRPAETAMLAQLGMRPEVMLELERILAPVRVSGTPEGATIRNLDGDNPDPLPVLGQEMLLPLGKSTLEISKEGYAPVQIIVEPKEGVLEKYAVKLEEKLNEERLLEMFTKESEGRSDTRIYGYIDSYFEKVGDTKGVNERGEIITESNPGEFDVPNLHVMVQGTVVSKYRYFVNLAAPGSGGIDDTPIAVRNAWVEAPLFREILAVRFGKLYRRFGIYNEILDAVPTFIGIEPPELFDRDHLLLTRTTNLMLFGRLPLGAGALEYSATTGLDERAGGAIPIGGDVRWSTGAVTLGSSGYWTGGLAAPTRAVGEGPPLGGVANWMASDEYVVYGGYLELLLNGPVLQAEYWQANHDAKRDPDAVAALAANPDAFIGDQRSRFFDDKGNVLVDRQYTVRTAYLRAGYEFPVGRGNVTPYGQADYYSNPEALLVKDYGGDNEAGLSDNAAFLKFTAGTVLRPVPPVALKVDGSAHLQPVSGDLFIYPEIRVSLAYLWELNL